MNKTSILNRILLLITCIISGYQIVEGMDYFNIITTAYLTLSFGTILLSCLFLMIFGSDILKNDIVVVIASFIPLSLSLGIVNHYFVAFHSIYLIYSCIGFISLVTTRFLLKGKMSTIVLAAVHGSAGILIFLLPLIIFFQHRANTSFVFISMGGILIGVSGLLLAFLKIGKPIIKETLILKILPSVLLIMTTFFIFGIGGVI